MKRVNNLELPKEVQRAISMERAFGSPPQMLYDRHFSNMLENARINPSKAIYHSVKAQDALHVVCVNDNDIGDEDVRMINRYFRSIRIKLRLGIHSGLLKICNELSDFLTKRRISTSSLIGGELGE